MANVSPLPTPPTIRAYESARAEGKPRLFSVDGEVFACLPECPADFFLDSVARLESGDGDPEKQGMASVALVRDFFDAVLLKNDAGEHGEKSSAERFRAKRRNYEEGIVNFNLLGKIMQGLMEDYGGRPTVPSSASPD